MTLIRVLTECQPLTSAFGTLAAVNLVNDPLPPLPADGLPAQSGIGQVPVVFFVGRSLSAYLPLGLETLARQAGLHPRNVLVFHFADQSPSVEPLLELFGFRAAEYNPAGRRLPRSTRTSIELMFPQAAEFLLVSGEFLLAPDFLFFFDQLLPLLRQPSSTLVAVSAWNENSQRNVSSNEAIAYRVRTGFHRPRHAVLAKRSFLDRCDLLGRFLQDLLAGFNRSQTEQPPDCAQSAAIVPDLSRVLFFSPQMVGGVLRGIQSLI